MPADLKNTTVVEGNAPPRLNISQGELYFIVGMPDPLYFCDQLIVAPTGFSQADQATLKVQDESGSSSTAATAIITNPQSLTHGVLPRIADLYMVPEPNALPLEDAWLRLSASRLMFETQLREFLIGKPRIGRPSLQASTAARRLLRAIERLDQPAIVVDDDDGVLSLDLRLNARQQMFIELHPDNQVYSSIYDDAARRHLDTAPSSVAGMVALIEGQP